MEERQIAELVESVRWRYSKTMPWCPHEYTVFEWRPELEPKFREFAAHIKEHGGWEPFMRDRQTWYFRFGGYKYWIMSEPWECCLINRTFIDFSMAKSVEEIVKSPSFKHIRGMSLQDIVDAYGARLVAKS